MLLHVQCETCATPEEPVKGIFVGFTQEQLRELIALVNYPPPKGSGLVTAQS